MNSIANIFTLADIVGWVSGLATAVKILLGLVTGVVATFSTLYFKRRTDSRQQDDHDLKVDRERMELESNATKSSIDAIETLRKNIERLNQVWVEENTLRTKAEASAIRKTVALELMKSICPDCYDKLPVHLKNK